MNEDRQILINLHSNELVNNDVKTPSEEILNYGEFAIGYADGHEKVFIKNDADEIVSFSPDYKINERIDELSGNVIDNEKVVAASLNDVNSRLGECESTIEGIESDIEEVDEKVDTLSGNVIDNEKVVAASLNDLNGRVGEFESSLEDIEERVENVENKTDEIDEKVDTLSGNVIDNEKVVAASLNDLNSKVGEVESSLDEVEQRVENVENRVGEVEDRVEEVDNKVDTLSGNVIDNEKVVAASLNELNSRVGEVETAVEGVEERIEAVEDKVEEVDDKVDSLSGNVIDNEKVVAASLNELNTKVVEVNDRVDELTENVIDDEKVIASSLNELNAKVGDCASEEDLLAHTSNTDIHVTAEDKETWNNKQDAIEDLEEIRNNALSGASAYTECIRIEEKVDTLSGNVIDNEKVVAASLNELNSKMGEFETSLDEIQQNVEEVDNKVDTLSGNVIDNEKVVAASLNELNTKVVDVNDRVDELTDEVIDNEKVVAASINDINLRLNDCASSEDLDEHISNTDIHVTLEDKAIWSGKQDAIEDLDDIRNNALSGASAYTALEGIEQSIEAVDEKVDTLSGNVIDNEKVVAASLNDVNSRLSQCESTLEDVGEVAESANEKVDTLSGNVIDNEKVIAASINDINLRLNDCASEEDLSEHTSNTDIHVTLEDKDEWSGKQDAIEDLSDIRNNALSGASAYTALEEIREDIETVDEKVDTLSGNVIDNERVVAASINDINYRINEIDEDYLPKSTIYFDGAEYNSEDKKIYFKKGEDIISAATIDATDFIKDGMVSNVEITSGTGAHAGEQVLKITFNTDAGEEPIEIPLTDIFDPSNYYTKSDIDEMDLINDSQFSAHTANTTVHITTEERNTWNAKQDAIADLSTIRNNALSGASAYTEVVAHEANSDIHVTVQDKEEWSGKQDAIEDLNTIRSNASSGASAYTEVVAHVADTDIHVTAADKITWNNKQDTIADLNNIRNNASSGASAYTEVMTHTADTTVHVTAQDKETWNNKQDAIVDLEDIRNNASSGASAYTALPAIEQSIEDVDDRVSELSGNVIDNEEVISETLNMFNEKFDDYTEKSDFTTHTADTSIHVTTAEKNTWNAKQDAISDLSTIRNNASSGASAYTEVMAHTADTNVHVTTQDKETWNNKQDAIEDLSTIRNNALSGASAYTALPAIEQSIEDVDDRVSELSGNVIDNEEVVSETLNMFNDKFNEIDDTIEGLATVATTGSYTDLLNAPTSNTAFTNDAGYITSADTVDFVTSADTKAQIEAYNYVNSGDVKTQVEAYHYVTSSDTKTQIESYNYVNSGDVKTQVEAYDYLQKSETYFDGAEYNSTDKKIYFKKGNEIISAATIDATDFIKDGMVSNVEITEGTGAHAGEQVLKVTFNTDAGQSPIEIPLTDIFDPSNYYTKNDIDGMDLINASTFSAHTGDTAIHVTTAEKTEWSGKQDAIDDLNTIRNNALSGASAYTELPQIKQDIEDIETEIESIPTPGSLTTTATTSQSTAENESLSGNISLHKIAKTGNYTDLLNAPTSNTAFTNDAGYITSADTDDFVTSADTKTQIEAYNYVNSGDVKTQIEDYNYVNSGDVKSQIEAYNYVNSGDVKTQVENYNYVTSADTKTQIEDYHYVNSGDVKTQIEDYNYVNSGDVKTQVEAYNYVNSGDVKTQIENYHYVTSADTKTQIESYNYVNSGDVKTQVENYNYVNSGDVKTQVEDYHYVTSAETKTQIEAYDYLPKSDTYFDGAEYNSEDKKIYFKKGNEIISAATIDATDFIKDGMVSNVEITSGTGEYSGEQVLKVTFNTDAGEEPIEIPIKEIFDPSNYYTKNDIDGMDLINESQFSAHTADTTIHVTTSEKTTWSGKQDAINDLGDIRNNALSGASAYTEVKELAIIVEEDETITAAAINDLNDRLSGFTTLLDFSAHTADTNVHVTTQEKSTWSGKQDAINDLNDIRNNASSGASAYSEVTAHTADTTVHVTAADKSTWNAKQDAIDDLSTIRNNASSGASAYTQVSALSATVVDINDRFDESYRVMSKAMCDLDDRISAHTSDTTVHVTSSDKSTWNAKQDSISDLSTIRNNASSGASAYTEVMTHTADTTVHVTSADKSTWSGKQDNISDLSTIRNNASSGASAYNEVTAHTADTTVHVTSADKSTWSGKQDAINDLSDIRNNASSGASAYNIATAHTADTTIHVTTQDKSTWNGKQDSISDLSTIRNNASSGATAYNIATGNTVAIADLQSQIGDIETLLSAI